VKNPGGRANSNFDANPKLSADELKAEVDAYDGAIAYLDDKLAQLLTELRKRNLLDHTILILTSDHGESLGEHGLLTHPNGLYREQIQVPLIFWGPQIFHNPAKIDVPVSNASIMPTVLDIVGVHPQTRVQAPSLLPLLQQSGEWNYFPIAELRYSSADGSVSRFRSVVTPTWHYVADEGHGSMLFKYQVDKHEVLDYARSADCAEVVSAMETIYQAMTTGAGLSMKLPSECQAVIN
jgi:arylsulfatase A-like enzyme